MQRSILKVNQGWEYRALLREFKNFVDYLMVSFPMGRRGYEFYLAVQTPKMLCTIPVGSCGLLQ
jgi:hypothetical protein